MPCDTYRARGEAPATRTKTIQETVAQLGRDLASGKARAVVGPQGGIAFTDTAGVPYRLLSRDRITDACAFRRIMASGSALARAAIAKAETLAGRAVDKRAVSAGVHSHDGGATWGRH